MLSGGTLLLLLVSDTSIRKLASCYARPTEKHIIAKWIIVTEYVQVMGQSIFETAFERAELKILIGDTIFILL